MEKKLFFNNPLSPTIKKSLGAKDNFADNLTKREAKWERKWNLAFGEKTQVKKDTIKTKPATKIVHETQAKATSEFKFTYPRNESTIRPEDTVEILEKINKQREEGKSNKTVDQKAKEEVKVKVKEKIISSPTPTPEQKTTPVDPITPVSETPVPTSSSGQKTRQAWDAAARIGQTISKGDPMDLKARELRDAWDTAGRLGKVVEKGDLLARMEKEGQLIDHSKDAKAEIKPAANGATENKVTEKAEPVKAEQEPAPVAAPAEPKKQVAKEAESVVLAEKQPGKNQPKTEEKNEEMRQALGSILTEQMRSLLEKRKAEENLKKYEEKWFNEGLAAEAKAKMEADKKIAAAEEKEAKRVWEIISRPRGIKEKLKIMFKRYPKNPTTYEEKVDKYLRGHYWTGVGLFGVGAAATLGTWAGMQATGNYLPFIGDPIKEVINNLFINGTLVK